MLSFVQETGLFAAEVPGEEQADVLSGSDQVFLRFQGPLGKDLRQQD